MVGGDSSDFDVHVKDCIAHDGDASNGIQVTDEAGCVVQRKLLGPWQKKENVNGASVIAYSVMQAFRFPDKMEVFFECNIEICKNRCKGFCGQAALDNSVYEETRFRAKRAVSGLPARSWNRTEIVDGLVEPVRLLRGIRVVVPNDLDLIESQNLSFHGSHLGKHKNAEENICLAKGAFAFGFLFVLIIVLVSCIITAVLSVRQVIHNNSDKSFPSLSRNLFVNN